MSWGRASIRVYRRDSPICVVCRAQGAIASFGSCRAVRNFSIWKRRPPRPMHSRRSTTGPALSSLIASATRTIRGPVIASNRQAITISPRRLIWRGAPSSSTCQGIGCRTPRMAGSQSRASAAQILIPVNVRFDSDQMLREDRENCPMTFLSVNSGGRIGRTISGHESKNIHPQDAVGKSEL
jgi:hypothetical protein